MKAKYRQTVCMVIILFLIFSFIVPTSRVGIVLKDMPADQAGIQTKDRIISIDSKKIQYWYELVDIVSKDIEGRPLKLQIERDKETFELIISPPPLFDTYPP